MELDWTAIAAIAGCLAAITAIAAILSDRKRAQTESAVTLIRSFDETFNSQYMHAIRSKISRQRLLVSSDHCGADVRVIFDFFESLAFYCREGQLPIRYAWFFFFSYVRKYLIAFREEFETERVLDVTLWSEILWLYDEMKAVDIDERRNKNVSAALPSISIDSFLFSEYLLVFPEESDQENVFQAKNINNVLLNLKVEK